MTAVQEVAVTPDEAEGAMQFVTDQQGNFATALLKMQDNLERIAAYGQRIEARLAELGAKLDRLADAAQRAEAERHSAQTDRTQLGRELAALRSSLAARRAA